jgi:hypothetical protein
MPMSALRALLQITCLIEDQYPARAQMSGDEVAHHISGGVLVPHRSRKQMLQPVWS